MKHLFVILLLAAAAAAFGRVYRNTENRQCSIRYSFRLKRKLNDRAGVFIPLYDRTDRVPRGGDPLVKRGGGGKVVMDAVRKQGKEAANIIIVGIDLKKKADGDAIPLDNDRTLYRIGEYRLPRRQTLAVFSFDGNDAVENHLPPSKGKTATPKSIVCPHCGQKIELPREKEK